MNGGEWTEIRSGLDCMRRSTPALSRGETSSTAKPRVVLEEVRLTHGICVRVGERVHDLAVEMHVVAHPALAQTVLEGHALFRRDARIVGAEAQERAALDGAEMVGVDARQAAVEADD